MAKYPKRKTKTVPNSISATLVVSPAKRESRTSVATQLATSSFSLDEHSDVSSSIESSSEVEETEEGEDVYVKVPAMPDDARSNNCYLKEESSTSALKRWQSSSSLPAPLPRTKRALRSIEPSQKAILNKIKMKSKDNDGSHSARTRRVVSQRSRSASSNSSADDKDDGGDEYNQPDQTNQPRPAAASPYRVGKCPFCDRPLPSQPSPELIAMLKYFKAHPKAKPRTSFFNPQALSLPAHLVSSVCQKHVNEVEVIPKGIQAGYPPPGSIDFADLPRRIERFKNTLDKIASLGRNSIFKDKALAEMQARKRSGNAVDDFGSFEMEQPGYYGLQGYEIILVTLEKMYALEVFKSSDGLSKNYFIRRVLLPEAAVQLISQDQNCPREEALDIMIRSREYGQAAHSPADEVLVSSKAMREARLEADRLAGRANQSSPTRQLRNRAAAAPLRSP